MENNLDYHTMVTSSHTYNLYASQDLSCSYLLIDPEQQKAFKTTLRLL